MKKEECMDSMEGTQLIKPKDVGANSPTSVIPTTVDDFPCNPLSVVDWLIRHFYDCDPDHCSEMTPRTLASASDDASQDLDLDIPAESVDTHPHPIQQLTRETPPLHPLSSRRNPSKTMPPAFRSQGESSGNYWNAKGLQHAKEGEWEAAVHYWKKALQIRSETLGHHHGDVANTLNNMGIANGLLGRYHQAMDCLEKALRIRIENLGRDHADVAATLHNMGNVCQSQGDYKGALDNFHEAVRIQEEIMGNGDKKVVRGWNAIGNLHFDHKQYGKARDAYQKARDTLQVAGVEKNDPEFKAIDIDLKEAEGRIEKSYS